MSGVKIVWPKALPKLIAADGPHGGDIFAISTHLRATFKKAKRT